MTSKNPLSTAFTNFLQRDIRSDQHTKFVSELDEQKIIDSLRLIERIYQDNALMLWNRSHPKLEYVSKNFENILGYKENEFKSLRPLDFFSLIHPEDLEDLQKCFQFINTSEPYDPITHRFILNYRIKHKDGKYIAIRDEKLAVKSEGDKYIYFTMFRSINEEEKFFQVKLDIFQYDAGRAIKVYTYNPRKSDDFITPRQNEIIKLIIQGYSTQEIAERLGVSINTIRNHKQVLFRKVNVKSSVELINYANSMSGKI